MGPDKCAQLEPLARDFPGYNSETVIVRKVDSNNKIKKSGVCVCKCISMQFYYLYLGSFITIRL